jgi:hypothetical protein
MNHQPPHAKGQVMTVIRILGVKRFFDLAFFVDAKVNFIIGKKHHIRHAQYN